MSLVAMIIVALVIGALIGLSVGVGTARMYHAPDKQGVGAFRTIGEINSCSGDPFSHFAFGFGFFLNSAAAAIGTGALTQDLVQRVIPNWGIAVASQFNRKKDVMQLLKSPVAIGLCSMLIGMIVMPLIVTIYSYIPKPLADVAGGILAPAATWLFTYIMPVLFIIAAMDAGTKTGIVAIIFGVLFQIFSGNIIPGIVLGILVGAALNQKGYKSSSFWVLLLLSSLVLVLIAYFRNFDFHKFMEFSHLTSYLNNFIDNTNVLTHSNFDLSLVNITGVLYEY